MQYTSFRIYKKVPNRGKQLVVLWRWLLLIITLILTLSCTENQQKEGVKQRERVEQEKGEILDIISSLKKDYINAEIVGAGLEAVKVNITKKINNPLSIVIPAGTYFKNRGAAQDMVVTKTTNIFLTKDQKVISIYVPAACANFGKDIPYEESKFNVFLSPKSEDLRKLIELIDNKNPSKVVKQIAVWIVTDNVTRSELDSRYIKREAHQVFGGSPAASDEDVIEAIKIVEEAGIDVSKKAIVKEKISLIKGLGSRKEEIVSYSARLLGYNGDKELNLWIIKTLTSFLKNQNAYLRLEAVRALGNLKDHRAVPPLIEALKDKNSDVRRTAAFALGNLKNYRAVPPLIETLKDENSDVRKMASMALRLITNMNFGANYDKWRKWWQEKIKTSLENEKIKKEK